MANSHRDLARRQHRTLGHYLAVEAWLRRVDCIVVGRTELEGFLGLKVFQGERVRWIQRDVRSWFPHSKPLYSDKPSRPLNAVYLSRVALDDTWFGRAMSNKERVAGFNKGTVRTALLDSLPNEEQILSRMVAMASGLITPQATH